jgi:hypothetical protein
MNAQTSPAANPIFTIKGNTYEIVTRNPDYDFAGWASYKGCVTTKRGPHPLRIVVTDKGSMAVDVSQLPRSLQWKVRQQLSDDVLNQVLYK